MRSQQARQPDEEPLSPPEPNAAGWHPCSVCLEPVPPHVLVEWHGAYADLYLHPTCVQELNLMLAGEIIRNRMRAMQHRGTERPAE